MIVYPALLILALAAGIPMCRKKAGSIVYCIIMGTALFAAAALRSSVGYDYNSYAVMYLDYMTFTPDEIAHTRIEKGYALINKLLADYIPDYRIIFVLAAAFFAAVFSVCICRYCKKPYLGFAFLLTFGVYFNSLNFLRQMIAAAIVLYALRYIKRDQFFRYVIIVLFASCFHLSALIMIPFFFILKIRMTPVTLGIYAGITALIMVFSWDILDFVTDYIYKGYDPRTSIHVTSGVDPTFMVFSGIFFIAAFIFRKRLTTEDEDGNMLINCMFFTFLFELLGVKHSILSRFGLFFIIPAALILMPRLFDAVTAWCAERSSGSKRKLTALTAAAVSAFAVVSTAMYGLMIVKNYNGVMPYRTVFDDTAKTEAEQ